MPADVDVLVGGSSPISFAPGFSFESEVDNYDATTDIKNNPSALYGAISFPAALSPGPASNPYNSFGNGSFFGSTSPPTHFTFHGRCTSPTLRSVGSPAITLARNLNQLRLTTSKETCKMPVAVPRRPCLVVRCDVLDLQNSSKSKKKVVFADDRGFPLALVRTMTEPSNMPPKLSLQLFRDMSHGNSEKRTFDPWEITFPQPASDYLDFRRRLDLNNVSLENVIVKENEELITGTVKVRNLVFHKEVFIRITSDDWKTQEDAFCTYLQSSQPTNGVTFLYDTFSFRLTLPPKSRKIEFCVCFRCSGNEYWDNNSGKNFIIRKKDFSSPPLVQSENIDLSFSENKIFIPRRLRDDVKPDVQLDSWSEFASWNHLTNDMPYW